MRKRRRAAMPTAAASSSSACVWIAYLMVYTARLSVGPLSPFLKDAFDLSNAQVGMLISATAITYAPSLIVAGWLVDRVGVRRMLVSGTLIAPARSLCSSSPQSYASLLVLLALSSIGAGCIFPSAVSAVMRWFPLRERATAIGVNQTAINVSGILGAVTLPTIAGHLGWQYGFLAIALMGLVVAVVCIVGYSDPPGRGVGAAGAGKPGRRPPACRAEGRPDTPPRPSTRRLLASRDVWLLGLFGLFLGAVEYSTLAHLVLYTKVQYLFGAVTRRPAARPLPGLGRRRQAARRLRERPPLRRPAPPGSAGHGRPDAGRLPRVGLRRRPPGVGRSTWPWRLSASGPSAGVVSSARPPARSAALPAPAASRG